MTQLTDVTASAESYGADQYAAGVAVGVAQQKAADAPTIASLNQQLADLVAADATEDAAYEQKIADLQAQLAKLSPPVATARFPGDPGLGKMYVGESVGGGDPSAREKLWGAKVGAFRSYFQWNDNMNVALRASRDLQAGRLPFISIKDSGSWANMASGAQDAILKDLMTKLAGCAGPVWLSIHHEPYDDTASEGSAADFGSMNKHVMSMLPKNVALVPILQSAPFDPTVGGTQSIAAWYPPGSYTFVGLDTYNHRYFSPAPGGNRWRDVPTVLSIVDKVRKDLGLAVPIAIAEFGVRTDPGHPGLAAQWLKDFAAQAAGKDIPAICYFDSGLNVNDGGTPWSLDDKTDGTDGTERINAYGPLVKAGAHL